MSERDDPVLSARRRPLARWAVRLGGGLVCTLAVLACAGALYQWIAGSLDRHAHPPPGRFVEVAGLRMHLVCMGQVSPTVVLDSGLSDTWMHWYKVQPEIAKVTRVCSYDRAGVGYSDPRPGPRTSRVIAQELHALLHNAGIAPPYVLVGHSAGGLNSLMFASLYRAEVAGMVLEDSSHPDQLRRFPEAGATQAGFVRSMQWQRLLMPFGIPRLLGWCGTSMPERRAEFRAFDCTVKQKQGWLAESAAFEESLDQVRATGSLGDMPLVVVSQAPSVPAAERFLALWYQLQDDLARRSSRGRRVVAQGSRHDIALDRPDVVIAAIREVVAECRRQ
jgi:pimeloyl-ACP methyl ester carboxylesterase